MQNKTLEEKVVMAWSIKTYLEWVNDWLTIRAMADHYRLSEKAMKSIIDKGREWHALLDPELIKLVENMRGPKVCHPFR